MEGAGKTGGFHREVETRTGIGRRPMVLNTVKSKEFQMFREEVAKIEGLAERINKLRGSL